MEEESTYDFKPVNSNCSPNHQVKIVDNGDAANNNKSIDKNNEQAKTDAQNDNQIQVNPQYGGNVYGLKDYEIIYNKKKIYLKAFNINSALLHLVESFKINKDCLFEVGELKQKKNKSIYHYKNNKKKIINKIR